MVMVPPVCFMASMAFPSRLLRICRKIALSAAERGAPAMLPRDFDSAAV